jgi:hypothetical protein
VVVDFALVFAVRIILKQSCILLDDERVDEFGDVPNMESLINIPIAIQLKSSLHPRRQKGMDIT